MKTIRAYISGLHADLLRNNETVAVYTAIAALVIGLGGFTLTLTQLANANRALKASNAYQIQRDARQLLELHLNDDTYKRTLFGQRQIDETFRNQIWVNMNFYLSVFRQHRMGGLTDEFANSYKTDFCQFLRFPKVIKIWDCFVKEQKIAEPHEKMRTTWCTSA